MEFIHTYTIEILLVLMILGLIGVTGCIGCLFVLSVQEHREQKKLELQKKVDLVLFMASNTNEFDYEKACENLGLCTKTSVTELIFGVHYE
jgi:hypothetical protein